MLEPAGRLLPLARFHIITVIMLIYLIISQFFTLSYLCAFTYFVTLHFCIIYNTYFYFKTVVGLSIKGIPFSHKKERSVATCYVHEPGKRTEWKKPDTKGGSCAAPFLRNVRNGRIHRDRIGLVGARGWGGSSRSCLYSCCPCKCTVASSQT